MVQKQKINLKKITFLLFSIFFFVGLFTFKDYGISIDEEYGRFAGFYWLSYVLSFLPFDEFKNLVDIELNKIHGLSLLKPEDYPFYGVIFDLPVAFLEAIFQIEDPKNHYYFKHFLNFLLFFISSIFFYKLLLNRFSNYKISIIGTLFFVLSPRIYGSSFFNNKDLIFLSLVTMAIYFCFKTFDKLSYKNIVIFSIFAALSTSQRILGIFIPIVFVFFYFLSFLSNDKNAKDVGTILLFLIFYYLFLVIFWPYLWSGPFENFVVTIKFFSDHPLKIKQFFGGEYINVSYVPYNYIFTWILISTPILYSILFIVGYFQIFKRFFLKFLNIKNSVPYYDLWRGTNEKKDLFILFSISSIIFYLIAFNVLIYTGWRQIYFINIFLIYIAAYALYRLDINLKSKIKNYLSFGFIIVSLLFIVYKMIVFHPYQNIYFNELFKKNAHENFEIDYWGLSGKKFLEDILLLEKDKNIIKIGVAGYLPLERSIKLLDKGQRKKIKILGQDFQNADYIYSNSISEVDKNFNDKYQIPKNFTSIDKFVLNEVLLYEIFKKK
jgi:hypothetical protein